jgi:hypothetical protein
VTASSRGRHFSQLNLTAHCRKQNPPQSAHAYDYKHEGESRQNKRRQRSPSQQMKSFLVVIGGHGGPHLTLTKMTLMLFVFTPQTN